MCYVSTTFHQTTIYLLCAITSYEKRSSGSHHRLLRLPPKTHSAAVKQKKNKPTMMIVRKFYAKELDMYVRHKSIQASVFKILYEINELDRQIDGTRTVT